MSNVDSDTGDPVDETAPWNFAEHGLADGYGITKHRAEELVRGATDLDVVLGYEIHPARACDRRRRRPVPRARHALTRAACAK